MGQVCDLLSNELCDDEGLRLVGNHVRRKILWALVQVARQCRQERPDSLARKGADGNNVYKGMVIFNLVDEFEERFLPVQQVNLVEDGDYWSFDLFQKVENPLVIWGKGG